MQEPWGGLSVKSVRQECHFLQSFAKKVSSLSFWSVSPKCVLPESPECHSMSLQKVILKSVMQECSAVVKKYFSRIFFARVPLQECDSKGVFQILLTGVPLKRVLHVHAARLSHMDFLQGCFERGWLQESVERVPAKSFMIFLSKGPGWGSHQKCCACRSKTVWQECPLRVPPYPTKNEIRWFRNVSVIPRVSLQEGPRRVSCRTSSTRVLDKVVCEKSLAAVSLQ